MRERERGERERENLRCIIHACLTHQFINIKSIIDVRNHDKDGKKKKKNYAQILHILFLY